MIKARTLKTAVALGSLTATVALLSGMPSASAQQAPGAGSFPNSFLIPGTNTSIRVGGYIKLDFTYDFQQEQTLNGGWSIGGINVSGPTSAGGPGYGAGNAANRQHNAAQLTASESRFNIETRTPTAYGQMKTFLEADFTNPSGLSPSSGFQVNSNSYGLRLRRAYGTLGPWLLGQTDSNFKDVDSEPETLDFGGPAGLSGVNRQPQIRYTYDAGNGFTIAGAIENPQSKWEQGSSSGTTSSFTTGTANHLPDFTVQARLDGAWGHVSLHGLIRQISSGTGGTGGAPVGSSAGGGGAFSGQLNTWGKDNLQWDVIGGQGLGRYILDDNPPDAAYNSTSGAFNTLFVWSATAGYQHWWLDNLRSTAAFGYVHIGSPSSVLGPTAALFATKQYYTVHANLIWSPIPQVDTGLEFMYGYKQVWGGADGQFERLQFSTKFKF